ncbi:CatB-related O-acetyltransferase [Muricoccus radiodurans]|uniref:CatB-related O-acetyltransferase n=1 Tax=Muricoccus radiodurans TaxID=2231721 RepID=UPI003CF91F35
MPDTDDIARRQSALKRLESRGIRLTEAAASRIHPDARFEAPCVVQAQLGASPSLSIGAYTGIFGAHLWGGHIGRYCSIAQEVRIGLSEHPTDWLSSSMIGYLPDVHGWATHRRSAGQGFGLRMGEHVPRPAAMIGNDVWIGYGAFVRSGVTIGDGAIIGAGAIVVADIPPYAIAIGNPARVLRFRFREEIVERLLRCRWWDWDILGLNLNLSEVEASLDTIEQGQQDGTLLPLEESYTSLREVMDFTRLS